VSSATPAIGQPLSDKRAQAAVIKKQMDALDTRMEVAVEDYDQALNAYQRASAQVARNTSRLRTLSARVRLLQTSLDVRADSMYRTGPVGIVNVLLGATSFEDIATTWDLLNEWNAQEAATVSDLRVARGEARRTRIDLDAASATAKAQFDVMANRKNLIESQIAQRKRMLTGVESEIAALEAADRAAQARRAAVTGGGGGSGDYGTPTRAPRSGVVGVGMRYLGRPYQWGAAGPGSFDCSGFTKFVYAQVGVSLPHSSRAQISCGERVSRANLRPGDLVFFGSPIHHVGMYIGGGQMINARNTGDVVGVDSIGRGNYAGACRP
jgi:cell wall-associated NlpC family hydrolase